MLKYKYFIFITTVLFLLSGQFVSALEVDYPRLGFSDPVIGPKTKLPEYIKYFFIFIFVSAGVIGAISLVISGVQILLHAGSPTAVGEARERIGGVILGIILLMFSFIILRTINPDLIKPQARPLPLQPGIYYWGCNGGFCTADDNGFVRGIIDDEHPDGRVYLQENFGGNPDVSNIPEQYKNLLYHCQEPASRILVWTYDRKNFVIDPTTNGGINVRTRTLSCGRYISIRDVDPPILSLRIDYEKPGVYFYLLKDCQGIASPVYQEKDSGIIKTFKLAVVTPETQTQPLSMKIINGDDYRQKVFAVLNKSVTGIGECSYPLMTELSDGDNSAKEEALLAKENEKESHCINIPKDLNGNVFNPYYVYVRNRNPRYNKTGGVVITSENIYLDLRAEATKPETACGAKPKTPCVLEIRNHFAYQDPFLGEPGGSDKLLRDMYDQEVATQIHAVPPPKDECTHLHKNGLPVTCTKTILPIFPYYTIIYTQNNEKDRTCAFFTNDVKDLREELGLFFTGKTHYRIDIIPKLRPN